MHTLHRPFTPQTTMLYRRIARRHWFVAISQSQRSMGPPNLRWAGMVYNGIPMDHYPVREDKDDYLFFLGRADEESRRRSCWPWRRRCCSRSVGRAVRAGDDRGHGLWHPGDRLAQRVGPGGGSRRRDRLVVSSVEEMAAAVARVGELDPQVMRARVKGQFSAEAMVAGYEHSYQQVLAGGDEATRVLRS